MPSCHCTRLLMTFVLPAALACTAPPAAPDASHPAVHELVATSPVPDPVIVALNSGIPDRRRLVIRSAAEWEALWGEATANQRPAPATPQFDFGAEMLLVATMGERPSGGYAIAIDSVYTLAGTLHAVVRETSPDSACFVAGVITSPVVVVRVPRSSAPVEFSTRAAVHLCS